jgi:sarcosine oxidase
VQAIADATAAAGVPGQWLRPEDAGERWPGLRFDTRVFHHAASGRLDADASVAALQQVAASAGAEIRHGVQVTAIRPGADSAEVLAGDEVLRASRVVVTAGAWTRRLLGGLVGLPPLRVTQEQPAHFAARAEGEWPSFIHYREASRGPFHVGYGMRTPGEGIKVGFHQSGPECDPDARDFAPDADRHRSLVEYVREWIPGVDADQCVPLSCTYTITPDNDFVVDAAGPLVVGAGFSGHGFKFAPVVGDMLADLALSGARAHPRLAVSRSS